MSEARPERSARFFFYGTLMDRDVLEAVLGRPVPVAAMRPAFLPGFRRRRRCGASYPVVLPEKSSTVEGIVMAGLGASDVAALVRYEGPAYRCARLDVRLADGRMVSATVFLPEAGCEATAEAWDLRTWRRRFARSYVRRVRRTRRAPSSDGWRMPGTPEQ